MTDIEKIRNVKKTIENICLIKKKNNNKTLKLFFENV